jgi:hypothetical protein
MGVTAHMSGCLMVVATRGRVWTHSIHRDAVNAGGGERKRRRLDC